MFRFNPDKELYKIKYGRRDKIVLSIFLLLVVISIGSTYALYQVRHSKRIIYTTVSDFSKDIKLAVYVDGNKQKSFPEKTDGYIYSEIKCDNGGSATFDYVNWELNLKTKGPDKCDVYFTKGTPNLTSNCKNTPLNKCLKENSDNFENLADDDPDHNIRYIGATPNNYIWFNCDDYTKVTDENTAKTQNCEKWRIIGLFKDMQKSDGTTEDLVKIVRDESIERYSWDNKNISTGAEDDRYGKNDWTEAELMYLLNPNNSGHKLNNVTANNSLYWNSGSGNCSSGQNNATIDCNFNSTGLKGNDNEPTKSMIESVKWYLGGTSYVGTETAQGFYNAERGETTYQNKRPTTWNGKVGLIYPSDYGYAAGNECLTTNLSDYNGICRNSDWLYNREDQWLLTPSDDIPYRVFVVNHTGYVGGTYTTDSLGIRPSLYLKSDVKITNRGGDGTVDSPYIITL